MTKLVVGSATDVGLVRSNNQDQYLVALGLYAVADGMGGHAAGEVASLTAIRALQAAFESSGEHTPGSLSAAAKTANRAVWDQARANRGMLGMGTTLVALAVVKEPGSANELAIAHIGDSRAYLLRLGALVQLTVDHSLVQELIDDGQITAAQAAVHPQRHVLTRALGVEPSVEVDLLHVSPEHGDRYLLCSDGLPREASDDQIAAVLGRFGDPSEAAKELVALANSRGGSDNVTVVVVDVLATDPTGEALLVLPGPASSAPGRDPGDGSSAAHGAPPVPTSAGPTGPVAMGTAPSGPHSDKAPVPSRHAGPGPGRRGRGGPRPVTLRVVAFVAAFCIVVGGAVAGLGWYARSTYFVTLSRGHIAIFQGRPGGVLWFGPTMAELTGWTASSVLPSEVQVLRSGLVEPSLSQAKLFISRQVAREQSAQKADQPPLLTTTTTAPKVKPTKPAATPTTKPAATPTTKAAATPTTKAAATPTTKPAKPKGRRTASSSTSPSS